MNKLLPILALLLATPIFAAEEAIHVQVAARYEGVDPVYLQAHIDAPQTNVVLPKITTRSGKQARLRNAGEFVFSATDIKYLGASLEVSPTIEGNRIKAIGKSTLCALASPRDKTSTQLASFKTLDTYLNQTFPNNKEVAIKLADDIPGTLYLTFTLLNREGLPVK